MKKNTKIRLVSLILSLFLLISQINLNSVDSTIGEIGKETEKDLQEKIISVLPSDIQKDPSLKGENLEKSKSHKNESSIGLSEIKNEFSDQQSLQDISIATNVTENSIVRSNDSIFITFTPQAPKIEYFFGELNVDNWIPVGQTDLDNITLDFPDLTLNEDRRDFDLGIKVLDFSDNQLSLVIYSYILDDNYVKIISAPKDQTKILGGQELVFILDPDPRTVNGSVGGIAWRWNNGPSSGASKIFAPEQSDGVHTLYFSMTDPIGRLQTIEPLEYNYYIDNTPPDIVPITNFGDILKAGTTILFENKTPSETGDPFTDMISWNFYYPALNLTYTNEWPLVPSPADTYELRVTAKDRLNNSITEIYTVKAGIAIFGTSINKFKASRPGLPLIVNISETPVTENYTWFRTSTGTIINSSVIAPPNVPSSPGDYELYIFVTDSTGRSDTYTDQVTVDGSPFRFTYSNPANNSVHYTNIQIELVFNESLVEEFFYFHWDDLIVQTGSQNIFLPTTAGFHNLSVYSADSAENYITTNLSFYKHLTQNLINPSNNHSVVDPGFNVSITFSEIPKSTWIHWDGATLNSTFFDSPVSSEPHTLNVTTQSDLGIFTSYYYIFTVRIFSTLTNQTEFQRLKFGTEIFLDFSETPSNWRYRWNVVDESSLIWNYDKKPKIQSGDQVHFLDVEIDNNEGTAFRQRFNFVGDSSAPAIISITPLTSKTNDSASVVVSNTNISIQITDTFCTTVNSCLTEVYYSYNNLPNNTVDLSLLNNSLPYTLNLPVSLPAATSDDLSNITIFLIDQVTHITKSVYYYRIDDVAPEIKETLYSNNSVLLVPSILEFNFTELTSGYVVIRKDNMVKNNNTFKNLITFDVSPDLVGYSNTTLLIDFYLTDLLGNSRQVTYTYTTQDKALVANYLGEQIIRPNENILFFINKNPDLVIQKSEWFDENDLMIDEYYSLNGTAPRNAHGLFQLKIFLLDQQNVWYNHTLSIFIDGKAPQMIVRYDKLNTTSLLIFPITITDPISSEEFTDLNVFPNQTISFNFTDEHFLHAKIGIKEQFKSENLNDSSILWNNTSFTYKIPFNATIVTFEIELIDELNNTQSYYISLNIFQEVDTPAEENSGGGDIGLETLMFWGGLGLITISFGMYTIFNWEKIKEKIKRE